MMTGQSYKMVVRPMEHFSTREFDTIAIDGLAEDQVTAFIPAFEGRTVATIN